MKCFCFILILGEFPTKKKPYHMFDSEYRKPPKIQTPEKSL